MITKTFALTSFPKFTFFFVVVASTEIAGNAVVFLRCFGAVK